MSSAVADPMIGRVLDGRYRVGPRIARGGMATVYEATDLRLDRVCALKIMHAGLGDDLDFADRFQREARSAARLAHPHVVSVFDQGDDDGTLFLAMEYVSGRTLRDLIRTEAPVSPERALELLEPVLSALSAAHRAGLIHRDIKPENVLLSDSGDTKVADFGLARAVNAETQHTAAGGVLIGTVSYLAPELVAHGRADPRADVYAAGVVLYELLTARKPHQGQSPIEVALKHVNEDTPPPSAAAPGIPPYVDALVARATARDPDRRPADARVLLHQAHRVRTALAQGLTDDADLTDDLAPTMPVQRPSFEEHVDDPDEIATVLSPAQAAHAHDDPDRPDPERAGDTGDLGVGGDRTDVVALPRSARTPPRTRRPAPRRSRRGPVLLLVVLLLAALAGAGGWWYGAGRFVNAPAVVQLSAADARAKVEAEGLGFEIADRAYSEDVRAGLVLSTDPPGGGRIARDGTVSAVISRGPERHAVPRLAGRTLDQARSDLDAARLTPGTTSYAWSDTVAKGTVMTSDPVAGARLRRAAGVALRVSKGPEPIRVPDVTGKDAQRATERLEKLRFKVSATQENSDTVDKGNVISQSPDDGRLLPGDKVSLVVSKGPVLVTVPSVTKMSVAGATAALEARGFKVAQSRVSVYIGLNLVVRQGPASGDRAPRGSTVTIFIV